MRLLENHHDSVIITDLQGIIRYWNPQATETFGYHADEMVDQLLWSRYPVELQGDLQAIIQQVADGGRFSGEYHDFRKDGSRIWIEATVEQFFDQSGNLFGLIGISKEITARNKVFHHQVNRFQRLNVALLKSGVACWEFRCDTFAINWEVGLPQLLHRPPQTSFAHQDDLTRQIVPSDRSRREQIVRSAATKQENYEVNYQIVTSTGEFYWVGESGQFQLDAAGQSNTFLAIARDITEKILREQALEQHQNMLLSAQKLARIGSWEYEVSSEKFLCSDVFCELLRITDQHAGIKVADWVGLIPPEERHTFVESFNIAVKQGVPFVLDHRVIYPDLKEAYFQCRVDIISDPFGKVVRLRGTTQDITDQKKYENILRTNEERLWQLIHSVDAGIMLIDPNFRMLDLNQRGMDILGISQRDVVQKGLFQREWLLRDLDGNLIPNEQYPVYRARMSLSTIKAEVYQIDVPNTNERRWLTVSVDLIFDAANALQYMVCSFVDISREKKSELAAKQQAQLLKTVYAGVDFGIFSIQVCQGIALGFTSMNSFMEKLFQGRIDEVCHQGLEHLAPQYLSEDYVWQLQLQLEQCIENKSPFSYEEFREFHHHSGWWLTRLCPITDRNGEVQAILGMILDITSQKSAENANLELRERALQAQKLEAIGHLAAGVAHEINNVLTVAICNANEIHERLPAESEMRNDAMEIVARCELGTAITQQLLAFSARQVLQPVILHIPEVIKTLRRFLQTLLGEAISIQTFVPHDLWVCKADYYQFQQVLMNLMVNARDAMPQGGEVTIQAQNTLVDDGLSLLLSDVPPGEYIELSITDTGTGMSQDTLEHIFEPFFTTKPRGKGTGLGLSTVFGIIQQSGGYITVNSKLNVGTTFRMFFPRAHRQEPLSPLPQGRDLSHLGNETILLVEDDQTIRKSLSRVMDRKGYHVISASNAADAYELISNMDQPFDLMITDVIMPGMTGYELAERLWLTNPDLQVIFISGYMEDETLKQNIKHRSVAYLQKPFSPTQLLEIIRLQLDPSQQNHNS
ncbi:MAG: PAS domain S-box protein [Zavarzinella sp.]